MKDFKDLLAHAAVVTWGLLLIYGFLGILGFWG